ncbi:MAG: hypothetical protein M0Z79_11650, partial [Nitrospiraceae bacterium]|nr:hypothetical protein [Nitrospiraceae bacterium]
FMAPTYPIGGSDSSCTRQGGVYLLLLLLVAMVNALWGERVQHERETGLPEVAPADVSIDRLRLLFLKPTIFSYPKVLRAP